MPITRRFLTGSLACLALSAMTTGCGTSETETASTTPPVVVEAPIPLAPSDKQVELTSSALEGQLTDAEGRVSKVAGEAQGEVKQTLSETKDQLIGVTGQLRAETTQAVEQIKGGAKKAVSDAEKEAQRRAKALKDGVEKSTKDLEKDVLDNFLPPR